MSPSIDRTLVTDRLGRYHPYTVAYRAEGSERYRDFGDHDPRDTRAHLARAASLKWAGDRERLADLLADALGRLDAPRPVLENVARLREPETVVVAAGHQPALFGGPLFVAFKLMSALRLCRTLNALDGPPFVPVFWNGSEEHNPAEFGRLTVFDREHDQQHITLRDLPEGCMAAATPIQTVQEALQALREQLPDTEFLPDLVQELSACAQGDLGEMISRLVLQWFGAEGLVVVEPRMLRALAVPVIRRALEDPASVQACLAADSEDMRARGFDPPLPHAEKDRTLVYRLEDGRRQRICAADDSFVLEETDQSFARGALLEEVAAHPERFGPSAALRPVVQAACLPVSAYVAGGTELAYHVQLRRLFDRMGQRLPLLVPRATGTLLKASCLKAMKRIELDVQDLIAPGWEWAAVEAAGETRGAGQRAAFETFQQRFAEAQEALRANLQQHGLRKLNELDREAARFLERLDALAERFRAQDPVVGEGPRRQYYRLRKFVLAGETYQELSAATVYFLALYGPALLPALLESIDPWTAKHHVFQLDT